LSDNRQKVLSGKSKVYLVKLLTKSLPSCFDGKNYNLHGEITDKLLSDEGKSVASFCRQVAALVPDMFCNFSLVNNHKFANKSARTESREKISTDLEYLEY